MDAIHKSRFGRDSPRRQPPTRGSEPYSLWRFHLAEGVCALIGVGIIARLFQLQVLQGDELRRIAEQRRYRRRPLPAKRASIQDRSGQPLTRTVERYHLVLDPMSVRNPTAVAHWLAQWLPLDPKELEHSIHRAQEKKSRYLRFATLLPPAKAEPLLKAYRAIPLRQKPAILNKEVVPSREYPHGRLAIQVLGLTQIEESREKGNTLQPIGGIEQALDEWLRGKNGLVEGELAPGGFFMPETVRMHTLPMDGKEVRLTLDLSIQSATEDALDGLCRLHHPKGALAIVLDARTGEILALANRPTFDPTTRKELEHSSEPLRNRAVHFRYEPGSTLKPLIVAMALSDEILQPSARFYCPGALSIGNRRIKCVVHGRRGHGNQYLEDVIRNSCNVAMAQIGRRAGLEWLYDVFHRLRLLNPMGVGLPNEWVGYTDPPSQIKGRGEEIRATNLAFGQGILVTPLALVSAFGILANEGRYLPPRLVLEPPISPSAPKKEVGGTGLQTQYPASPVMTPEATRLVIRGLVQAVEEGTGKRARVPGYWVAGKTGTAQKAVPKRGYSKGLYISSFIGIVPADRPRAIILVLADEPQNGYYGGEVCAPTFRQIAQFLMWYWKVTPNRKGSERWDG